MRLDTKTVQQYFQILEDTLLCFFLEPHHTSLRKRQSANPKCYLIDIGIWRALTNTFSYGLKSDSVGFGNLFEHFVIAELRAVSRSRKTGFEFFFYRKDDQIEVDLIIERPGQDLVLLAIKSHSMIEERHVKGLNTVAKEYPKAEVICLSLDKNEKQFGRVRAMHWTDGL